MKTAAIIAEYNPFHNGHKYHIEETKKHADRIIILMSGSFVQRGEPSIYSKWSRAAAAVRNGADLVLELPFYYAVSSSRDFAFGAVKIIDALGTVDLLSFGSESADADILSEGLNEDKPSLYSDLIKRYQKDGLSYPAAEAKAAKKCGIYYPDTPNDLLASEYIKALTALKSGITPLLVKRTAKHDSSQSVGRFLSASAIRDLIKKGEDISSFIPESLDEAPLFFEDLSKLIYLSVLNLDRERFTVRSLSDTELINTICKAVPTPDITSYLYNIKSKRYTMSRVKRTLLHILVNSGEKIPDFEPYSRVLALNDTGREILRDIKKSGRIKIITKLDKEYVKENPSLRADIKATDIRSLALGNMLKDDFTTSPIKL